MQRGLEMAKKEVPKEVKDLVDMLGQAFVHSLVSDEASQGILKQIQERGFEVLLAIEATVALRSRCGEAPGITPEEESAALDFLRDLHERLERAEKGEIQWSEEDRAILCNFRISLD